MDVEEHGAYGKRYISGSDLSSCKLLDHNACNPQNDRGIQRCPVVPAEGTSIGNKLNQYDQDDGQINAYINYIQRPACIMIKLIDSYHPAANGCNNL